MTFDPFCEAMGDVVEGQRLVCDKLRPHSGQHYDIAMQRFFDALPALPVRCDYCGDALPSVKSRVHMPTTPDLQRIGFDADKVVCPDCVAKARAALPDRSK